MIEYLYSLQRTAWKIFKPKTRGVKVLLFDAKGDILLIRNSYGNREQFVLPGGGVRLFESPISAASREVEEETACRIEDISLFGVYWSGEEGKRDQIFVFKGSTFSTPVFDQRELLEASFFPLSSLPISTSPATRRRISEYAGQAAIVNRW